MNAFIQSQFGYSPLTWMFHDRAMNHKINKVHERALRFVYNNNVLSFNDLLIKDGSLRIHHRNIHVLALEMFKIKIGLGSEIMKNIFFLKRDITPRVNTRSMVTNDFYIPQVNTVHYGHDSLRYFGPKIWDIVPLDMKLCDNVAKFKSSIKTWIPNLCPCRICLEYIAGVGYVTITS